MSKIIIFIQTHGRPGILEAELSQAATLGELTRMVRYFAAHSLGGLLRSSVARYSLKRPFYLQWSMAPQRPVPDAGSPYGSFDLLSNRRLLARRVSQIRKITPGRRGEATI